MTETCVHRWRVEPPTPGVQDVSGECQRCGKVKTFPAFGPDDTYVGWGFNQREPRKK